MAVATAGGGRGYAARPAPSGLADVIDVILDKGLVIASVDTYLRFAEAVNRLDLQQADQSQGLPELMESITEGGSKSKTKGALEGAKEKLGIGGDDEEKEEEKSRSRRRSSSSQRSRSRKSDEE